jgi:hypothetical protein
MRIETATKKELRKHLNSWERQGWSKENKNCSPARTSYKVLHDIIHLSEGEKNLKIKMIKQGRALLGVIEYNYEKRTNELWIHNLASSPNIVARKTYKGIGTSLLLYAIKYGIKIGAKKICLYSVRDKFYKKFGFIRMGQIMILRLCKKIIHKILSMIDKA